MDENIVQVEIFHKDNLIYNEELPCELAADGEGHHIKFPERFWEELGLEEEEFEKGNVEIRFTGADWIEPEKFEFR